MEKFFSRIGKNKKVAKSELYKRYGKKLYGYAITKWKVSEDEAWELVYKTIDRTVETFDRYTFETETKFASFIFKVFINYLRNHYRDNKSKTIETVLYEDSIQSKVADNDRDEENESLEMQFLKEELQKLEDWQRVLLLMRAQNYSYNEIADLINKPADQLKVYHMRCKQRIVKNLNARINNIE